MQLVTGIVNALIGNGGDLLLGVGLLGGAVACATLVAFLRMKLTPG